MTHTSPRSENSAPGTSVQAASESPLVFEISRGRTDSPLRPISRDRFLIGAGDRCDLRLGGTDIPAVHSVVHIDGDEIWLETLADAPPLKLNGRLTRSAALEPGDELEIGCFGLTLHRTSAAEPVPAPRLHKASIEELIAEDEEANDSLDFDGLSAAELIGLIEKEEAEIQEFEARRQMGARALIDVARQRFGSPLEEGSAESSEQKGDPRELFNELQLAIASLNAFAQDFEHRAQKLDQRESNRVANSLLDFQQQIVGRLDDVLSRIATLENGQEQQSQRRDVA